MNSIADGTTCASVITLGTKAMAERTSERAPAARHAPGQGLQTHYYPRDNAECALEPTIRCTRS